MRKIKREQKAMGVVLAVLGLASAVIEGDGTVALLLVPLGIALMLTKKIVVR